MASSKRRVVVTFSGSIAWFGFFDQENRTWLGACPSLNLNAIGDTWDELQACASDAMQLLFSDLFKTGELERFLRENRWRPLSELPTQGPSPRFDMPFMIEPKARYEDLVGATA